MNSKLLLLTLLTFISTIFYAQEKDVVKATSTGLMLEPIYVPSIAQQIKDGTFKTIDQNAPHKEGRPKKTGTNITVPGKGLPKGDDPLINLQKSSYKIQNRAPSLVFDADISQATPSDPTGAVGPNHYLAAWNSAFRIFDKSGNPLTDEASLSTIFPGNDIGDPIMLYDAVADRFIITEFDDSPNGFNMAISEGPDPVNDGWYIYTTGFETGSFPDYTKFSIWSDGYYVTANTSGTNKVFVVERDKMLLGEAAQFVALPLTGISTSGFYSPQVFNVGNQDMPTNGNATVVYMQDDAWIGVTIDHLKLWTINIDWNDTANSTISAPKEMATSAFTSVFDGGSFSNLSQPSGPDIDAMQATIMNQAQFRKFANHNSAVFNFVVDTDGTSVELAGVRWFELRQENDSAPWTLYQEGTYISPYNGKHAFAASMAMDVLGNIGMGYTTVSTTESIAIYYTGRYANDPLGTMSVDEQLIAQGSSNDGSTRYADYTHLTIDPVDDKTFWHIAEYFNSSQKDVVGVFKIAPDSDNDVGITNIDAPVSGILTNSETVTVSIFNYGQNDASNFGVSYQIDGGAVITETFTGTLSSNTSVQFSFSTTADFSTEGQTYSVMAETSLAGDEDTSNNSLTQEIIHLFQNDIGVVAITSPNSGNNMSMETISVTIQNFGGSDQSNFDVSYTLQGYAPVIEQVSGPLASGATVDYSFTTQGNFTTYQEYNLSATTSLGTDSDVSNDEVSILVSNSSCNLETNVIDPPLAIGPDAGSLISSIINFASDNVINDINVTINLNHTWNSDLDIFLTGPDGTVVELSTDNGDSSDNYIDTVFDDDAATPITDGDGPFTGSFQPEGSLSDFNGLSSLGDWTLEITDDAAGDDGDFNSWSLEICNTTTVGIYDNIIDSSDLIINTLEDNHFDISLTTEVYAERLTFKVFNILGQEIVHHVIEKQNGSYSYPLDMSYVSSGVYIIRLGNESFVKVKKIIVE